MTNLRASGVLSTIPHLHRVYSYLVLETHCAGPSSTDRHKVLCGLPAIVSPVHCLVVQVNLS